MKNTIICLLFLLNIELIPAQYSLSLPGTSAPYTCTIHNADTWTDKDLLTWIFPDGQFKQKQVQVINNGLVSGSNAVAWTPYAPQSGPLNDNILFLVAKKGGSGPPPPALLVGNKIVPFNALTTPPTPPSPTAYTNFTIVQGNCKVGHLWDFSKLASTYLVVSYRNACTGGYVEISYPTNSVELEQFFGFQGETFDPPTITNGIGLLKIRPGSSVPAGSQFNVFLKMKPTAQMDVGQTFKIFTKSHLCPSGYQLDSMVIDSLQFILKGGPHDPNYKKVDIDTIYNGHANALRLTYTIQFHNDGNAPVKKVVVTDVMPAGLNPATFHLVDAPAMNGLMLSNLTNFQNLYSSNLVKEIIFEGAAGLPGINEPNASYSYDQTIYRFKFGIDTDPNFKLTINNDATITFYDNNVTLPHIVTGIAPVYIVDQAAPGPRSFTECCCNWTPFWCRFFNIFRGEKLRPCK